MIQLHPVTPRERGPVLSAEGRSLNTQTYHYITPVLLGTVEKYRPSPDGKHV